MRYTWSSQGDGIPIKQFGFPSLKRTLIHITHHRLLTSARMGPGHRKLSLFCVMPSEALNNGRHHDRGGSVIMWNWALNIWCGHHTTTTTTTPSFLQLLGHGNSTYAFPPLYELLHVMNPIIIIITCHIAPPPSHPPFPHLSSTPSKLVLLPKHSSARSLSFPPSRAPSPLAVPRSLFMSYKCPANPWARQNKNSAPREHFTSIFPKPRSQRVPHGRRT